MHVRRLLVVLVALTMVATVGVTPAGASHGVNGKICIVNDTAGAEDPLNASAAEGAKAAQSKLHVNTETLNADTEADITANIDYFVTGGDCDLIFGLGFVVGGLMEPFVAANPDQDFVTIDFGFGGVYPNVAEVIFSVNEAAFLAGYVAAGISETGKVGVFGGLPIPPVTLFMDGYALGVDYYNSIYGTTVEVLGWDPDTQTGLFSFDFGDPAIGQALASDLYDAGADTVFPVAGRTSFGALEEAIERKAAGESVRVIGVDFDYYDFFGDPDRVILTSVVKDWGVAVFNQTAALVDGTWMGGLVEEGLESGGVDIAPFHKLNWAVPGFLKNDMKSIRVGIIDGTIQTLPGAGDGCGQPIPSIEPVSVVNGDVVFSQTDGTLWVYEPDSGALVEHPLPFGGVWDIQWNGPNTRLLMANTTFPRIVGLDLRTGEFTEVLCGAPLQFPLGISTDPTEPSTLWIADSAGVIRHDMASGETEVVVEPSASSFDGVAVSPDGEVYVTDGSPNLYRVAPGETNDVTLVATVDGYGLNGLVFDNEGFVFDAPGTLIATAMSPSAQVAIDAETGAFDLIDFATDMRSSEDTDFTRSGDRYVIDSGLVGDNFGVDPGLYLLPRGATEVIELLRGAPLGDTVDILVARNVFPDIGEWFFNEATGHWYTLIAADTFEAAEAQAVGLGGHLVTVNDAAEQAWLYDTFDVNPFVIGLNDIGEEGNFVWTSGEPVTYTNWCPGEPSNGGPDGEDLVHMGFIDGCWNDVPNDLVGIAIVETDQAP